MHAHDVPIITDNGAAVARFARYSMWLHLLHRDSARKRYGIQWTLMLLCDMPALCQAVRWNAFVASPARSMVLKYHDEGLDKLAEFKRADAEKFRLRIHCQPTEYLPMTVSYP
jgi:hypothetical protein